jgi:chorismate-pyruvate lyase
VSLTDIDTRVSTGHNATTFTASVGIERSAADVPDTGDGNQDHELEDRAVRLKRLINTAPTYTAALSWWTGFAVRRTARVPDTRREVNPLEAKLLDVPPGTRVTVRDGFLVPAMGDPAVRLAAVTALVYEPALRLDIDGQAVLRHGSVPLGELLGAAVHRATQFTVRIDGPAHAEAPALYSQARLLVAGRPVAMVTETTYWWPLLRRTPATVPQYVEAAPWTARP